MVLSGSVIDVGLSEPEHISFDENTVFCPATSVWSNSFYVC